MQSKLAIHVGTVMLSIMSAIAAGMASADEPAPPLYLSLSRQIEVGAPMLAMSGEQRRVNAVALARANQLATAARILTALHSKGIGGDAVLYDLLSVLSWSGSHLQVLALAESIDAQQAPVYVLEAVASSARRGAQFDTAISWYELALARAPNDTSLIAGLALSQADAGKASEARETFADLPVSYRNSLAGGLLDAYLWRASGDRSRALLAYDRVLAEHPDHREALLGKFHTLRDMLLVEQALAFAADHPGLATRSELESLYVDRAALWVRWGAEPVRQGPARYADLDRALTLLEQNLARFSADTALGRITRLDRIAALHARGRHAEVVEAYDELGTADAELPVYVLRAVAGSRLALREPEEALRLYQLALTAQPGDFDLRLDLFFALVELERHDEARTLANELVSSQRIWRTVPGSRVVKPNPRRLKAEITHALSRAYADDLVGAQAELDVMLAEAPHNTDVRQELGNVYRWRGWPRRALYEYEQVMAVEDDLLSARIGLANSLLDLGMGERFESVYADLSAEHDDDGGVRRLERRFDLYHRNEFSADANGGKSSGEQFGSRQHQADARFYLGGTGYHWRPFVALHAASAEFSDGTARRRRAGAGLQYRTPDHTLEAAVTGSVEDASRIGLALAYGWDIDDRWRLDGLLESASHALPLRAYRSGISSDRMRIAASFRHSELLRISAAGEVLDFSDGNTRTALLLDARRRVANHPRFKLDLTAGIYASRNDLANASYYNPDSDSSVSFGADARWRMFRRYERNFDHQLILNVGRYSQSGFDSGSVGSVEYRQILQLSDALELYLGVSRVRALYDGNFEYGTFYHGGLRGRF